MIEDFLWDENLYIFNDDSTTNLHPASVSATPSDLSLCDPDLYFDYTWRVNEDRCSSDHYPIIMQSNNSVAEEKVQYWIGRPSNSILNKGRTISELENEDGIDDPIALF